MLRHRYWCYYSTQLVPKYHKDLDLWSVSICLPMPLQTLYHHSWEICLGKHHSCKPLVFKDTKVVVKELRLRAGNQKDAGSKPTCYRHFILGFSRNNNTIWRAMKISHESCEHLSLSKYLIKMLFRASSEVLWCRKVFITHLQITEWDGERCPLDITTPPPFSSPLTRLRFLAPKQRHASYFRHRCNISAEGRVTVRAGLREIVRLGNSRLH